MFFPTSKTVLHGLLSHATQARALKPAHPAACCEMCYDVLHLSAKLRAALQRCRALLYCHMPIPDQHPPVTEWLAHVTQAHTLKPAHPDLQLCCKMHCHILHLSAKFWAVLQRCRALLCCHIPIPTRTWTECLPYVTQAHALKPAHSAACSKMCYDVMCLSVELWAVLHDYIGAASLLAAWAVGCVTLELRC